MRTLTPAAAGASGLRYRRFLPASLAGSLLWAGLYVGIGAFAGASASRLEHLAGQAGLILLGVLVVVVIVWIMLRRRAPDPEPPAPTGRLQDEPEPGDHAVRQAASAREPDTHATP